MFHQKVFTLSLLLVCCLSHFSVAACHLKVRTHSVAPMATKNANNQWVGLDIDYINALLQFTQCSHTLVDVPWNRALQLIKTGQIDLLLNVSKTPEREGYLWFIGPQRQETLHLITRKDWQPTIKTWQQLGDSSMRILHQRGTFLGQKFEHLIRTKQNLRQRLVTLTETNQRLEILRRGKADGILVGNAYLYAKQNSQQLQDFKTQPLLIHSSPIYYGFSKASINPKQLKQFEFAFKRLQNSGYLEQLAHKYGLPQQ